MMEAAEYLLQVDCYQTANPNIYKTLLASLQSCRYALFKSLLKRGLGKQPKSIEIDYVYPYPLSKTLLDVACCEGLCEFVDLLLQLDANPNKLNTAHNRGPIHFATELGHVDVLRVLLEDSRTNPNLEAGRETALHFAVKKNDIECVKILLDNNASPNIANAKGATPMHIAAATAHEEMITILLNSSRLAPDLDNFLDFRERSPRDLILVKFPNIKLPPKTEKRVDFNVLRFYLDAYDEQHLLENLDKVDINQQDIDVPRLLIMTASKNFRDTVKLLIERWKEKSAAIIEEVALVSIKYGHTEILTELLQSNVLQFTSEMLIASCRELGVPTSQSINNQYKRLECLKMILDQPGINVRCEDDKGNTPLHYAARAECGEAVSLLLKSGSYLGHMNILGIPPLAQIPFAILEEYFDECLDSNDDRTDDYEINFDYTCLMPHTAVSNNADDVDNNSILHNDLSSNSSITLEMDALRYIASNRSLKNLLKHPLLSSYLYLKWHRIRQILYVNFIFYILFYIFLNCYILLITHESRLIQKNDANIENTNVSTSKIATTQGHMSGLWCLLMIFLILLILRESFQFISSPVHYIYSFENWLEILLIVLTTAIVIGAESRIGAAAILLSAWELVILISQHPRMSTGIEMFKTVSINLIIFLLPYALLILAFAMAFFTLFKDGGDANFPDPGHSLFKTIIMLTGEFDADGIPFVSHPVFGRFVFVLFVFLIAIVLFNLLIGLAVSDTADILNKSELVGLISRTELITYAERIVMGSSITKSPRNRSFLRWPRIFAFNYLGKRLLFFPRYLPYAKIAVKPNKENEIRIYGRNQEARKCMNFFMDAKIILKSKEILSTRGKTTEHEKIMNSLEALQCKISCLEDIIDNIKVTLQSKN